MGSPLRILHVVVNMNRGGAETLIMNLYRNIDRAKVQFDFLTCKEGVFDAEIRKLGGRVHRIPYVTEVGHRGYIKELYQFFKKNPGYLIVHSHMDKMSGLVLREAKRARIPIRIAHSHNTRSEGSFVSRAYKWYVGEGINTAATHSFACSSEAAEWLFKNKYSKAYMLRNGIETDKFQFSAELRSDTRKELGLSSKSLVIGHVGRFNHQKNHAFLLEIFADFIKIHPDARLVLVGDGVLRPKIEAKIKELRLEKKVRLLGIREDIHRLLQAFDVFVFPSFHEGLPVTLVEAQASGLPCIISDTITKEVQMEENLVEYLPLANKEVWITKIQDVNEKNTPRNSLKDALNKKGYDIRKTVRELQHMYLTLGEESSENFNRFYSNIQ
ncbi:glycosyltransferase family 1 protein [Domibacillus sp. PGB-M46]|uniref:glycosyltransferase family 1 protein n=1 Tax=Domibacillus sp. PGB-M46 TaxID=2910255 RepID=UPI001F570BFD|nr:glycosyltransferase family 1 protein [Domibacillus sp. PGB-M46]MCI2252745.1 glycosyltransferase family 1 protein [Domibacillus sp. PGB-M46]